MIQLHSLLYITVISHVVTSLVFVFVILYVRWCVMLIIYKKLALQELACASQNFSILFIILSQKFFSDIWEVYKDFVYIFEHFKAYVVNKIKEIKTCLFWKKIDNGSSVMVSTSGIFGTRKFCGLNCTVRFSNVSLISFTRFLARLVT